MKEASQVTALVFDNGLFLPVAQRLAKTFKRVLYQTPWEKGFSTLNDHIVGDGFENVELCEDFWKVKKDVDCWCFPDIQHAGLQLELESQGFPVWGSRNGDSIELNRVKFHRILREVGLPAPEFKMVYGLASLREHLSDKTDKYIKISKYRGTMETWHWRDKTLDSGRLDALAVKLGPFQNHMPFLVVDPIDCVVEVGGDTFCVDGQWPSLMLHGDEEKDRCYFGAVTPFDEMPDELKAIIEAFSPVLKKERYRNQFSMETRDGRFIDPTMRGGLPSTASQLSASNFPEIVWAGANGELIEPDYPHPFTAEAILTLKGKKEEWGKIRVEGAVAEACQFAGACEIDGMVCWPPDGSDEEDVGWIVAGGDTPTEAIENLKQLASDLPDGLSAATEDFAGLLNKVHDGEADGITMTDEIVPEPEIAVN
ncbi:MAG TPA: hypothetical protein VMQ67_08025 [Candidatus Saccharimonadales bacterium]|nr:hypothetical protein [Candidatus Saccharimonadales bacterium]